jgi:hypothetical protein
MPRLKQGDRTVRLVRDLLQGLEAQAEDEARETEYEEREAAGRKRDQEYHDAVVSIAYSLRSIEQTLNMLRMDIATGALRPSK